VFRIRAAIPWIVKSVAQADSLDFRRSDRSSLLFSAFLPVSQQFNLPENERIGVWIVGGD
jgi:hypothetical protein